MSGKTEKETVKTFALIDSRAGGEFIDQNYARNSGLDMQQLEKPLKVFNIDRTSNSWRKNEHKNEQKKEQKKPYNNSRCFTFTKKDPNMMDID